MDRWNAGAASSVATEDCEIRPYRVADERAVLALIGADRLTGQPEPSASMLAQALAGQAPVDTGWWSELSGLRTDVLADSTGGQVRGVVSYAQRPRDGTGVILWLHGHEDPDVIAALLSHACAQLDGCARLEAFSFASALGLGLEALPVRHRRATDRVLRDAGFASEDLWRYMQRSLPAPDLPTATGVRFTESEEGMLNLRVPDDDRQLGEATIGLPTDGIGVLWWISIDSAARSTGLGRRLLGSALQRLTEHGASEVILFVDDDDPDPTSDRSRVAANRLYDRTGFTEIDRLHSYYRRSGSDG